MPLYNSLAVCNGDDKARQFNVVSKHSLEKTAAHQADIFTTVSDITANECHYLIKRDVDVVTPNGVSTTLSYLRGEEYGKSRTESRSKLLQVASAMTGKKYADDTFIIGISGRYEFRNKGIDLFLDALGRLKADKYAGREILAYLMIPAGNNGPGQGAGEQARQRGSMSDYRSKTTHYLSEPEYDQILAR